MPTTTVHPAQLEAAARLMGHVADGARSNREQMLAALDRAGDALRCGATDRDNAWAILNSKTQVLESALGEFGHRLDAAAKAYLNGEDAIALAFIPPNALIDMANVPGTPFEQAPLLPFVLDSLEEAADDFTTNSGAWAGSTGAWSDFHQLIPEDGWRGPAAGMAQAAQIALLSQYSGLVATSLQCANVLSALCSDLGHIKQRYEIKREQRDALIDWYRTTHGGTEMDSDIHGLWNDLQSLCDAATQAMTAAWTSIAGLIGDTAVVGTFGGPDPLAVVINENPVALRLAMKSGMAPVSGARVLTARHGTLVTTIDSTLLNRLLNDPGMGARQRQILREVAGTGATPVALEWLAGVIAGKSDTDLNTMVNIVGQATNGGVASGIVQYFSDCGQTSVEVAVAERDPLFALFLSEDDGAADFFEQLVNIQDSVGINWDKPISGQGAIYDSQLVDLLNSYSDATGLTYTAQVFTGADQLSEVEAAVNAGHPVLLHVEHTSSDGTKTGHAVAVIAATGGELEIHDPATGLSGWITDAQFNAGDIGPWYAKIRFEQAPIDSKIVTVFLPS